MRERIRVSGGTVLFSHPQREARGVKRKLAGRVLHVRPTVWIKLEDGSPPIETLSRNPKLWSLVTENRLTVEVGDEIKVYAISLDQTA